MGRIPICECGYVKLFEPGVNTPGNSQHIADWYTPSHIIHGFLFYWFAWLLFRNKPLSMRLSLAVLVEAAWEILENSPIIIDRSSPRRRAFSVSNRASATRETRNCWWITDAWLPHSCFREQE